MLQIKGLHIRLSRGDSACITIEAAGLELSELDRAVVTVKKTPDSPIPIIENTLSAYDGVFVWEIGSADTVHLSGMYYWDLRFIIGSIHDSGEIVENGARIITPFSPQPFEIMEVIGDASC